VGGNESRQRGLAASRRPPQDQGLKNNPTEQPMQDFAFPEEMSLPDKFFEAAWAKPFG